MAATHSESTAGAPDAPERSQAPEAGSESRRYTAFAPRQRGTAALDLGSSDDAETLRALAAGGAGWLHHDGRVLANGTCSPIHAHAIVPGSGPLVLTYVNAVTVAHARFHALAAASRDTIGARVDVDGRTYRKPDPAIFEEADQAALASIRNAGWTQLTLRRDRGVKEMFVDGFGHAPELERHLAAIAKELDCRVVSPHPQDGLRTIFEPSPRKKAPSHDATRAAHGDALALRVLEEVPGFQSYDPATGDVVIDGWGRTKLLREVPGSRDEDAKPSDDADDASITCGF